MTCDSHSFWSITNNRLDMTFGHSNLNPSFSSRWVQPPPPFATAWSGSLGGRFRFTIRHEVSKTSPPVIWRPPTYVATAVAAWIVAISLLRLGPWEVGFLLG